MMIPAETMAGVVAESDARLAALRAENTRLRDEVSDVDALRARVAELEADADAARYRWLKAEHDAGYSAPLEWLGPYPADEWDAAIDAERAIPSAEGEVNARS